MAASPTLTCSHQHPVTDSHRSTTNYFVHTLHTHVHYCSVLHTEYLHLLHTRTLRAFQLSPPLLPSPLFTSSYGDLTSSLSSIYSLRHFISKAFVFAFYPICPIPPPSAAWAQLFRLAMAACLMHETLDTLLRVRTLESGVSGPGHWATHAPGEY